MAADFLETALLVADNLLNVLTKAEAKHPLAEPLFDSVLSVREILNCWDRRDLHAVAHETLSARAARTTTVLSLFGEKQKPLLTGMLQQQVANNNWTADTTYVIKNNALYLTKMGKQQSMDYEQVLALSDVVTVREVHNGKDSVFEVEAQEKKTLIFRAASAVERLRWVKIISYYIRKSTANRQLASMTVCDRAGFYLDYILTSSKESKTNEFIFALAENNHDRTNGTGLVERFPVLWPQKIGRPKRREIEIDLNPPCRMLFYKQVKKSANSVSPEIIHSRDDLLDYKISDDKLELDLTFRDTHQKKTWQRHFLFTDTTTSHQFLNILIVFLHPSDLDFLTFYHEDALRQLLTYTNNTSRRPRATQTNRKLRPSISDMNSITARPALSQLGKPNTATVENYKIEDSVSPLEDDSPEFHIDDSRLTVLFEMVADCCPTNKIALHLVNENAALSREDRDPKRLKILLDCVRPDRYLHCSCEKHNCRLLFFKSLLANGGLNDLQTYLLSTDGEVQQWTVRTLWFCNIVSSRVSSCAASLTGNPSNPDEKMMPFSWYIAFAAQKGSIRVEFMDALFEILTDTIPTGTDVADANMGTHFSGLNKTVTTPEIMPIALNALTNASLEARVSSLKTIILLLQSPSNAPVFLDAAGWQNWLFQLFVSSQGPSNADDPTNEVFRVTMAVFTSLHYYALTQPQQKEGFSYNVMWKSMQLIRQYAGWTSETVSYFRVMLISLLIRLKGSNRDFMNNWHFTEGDTTNIDNLVDLIGVIDNFLFHQPSEEQDPNSEGERVGLHFGSDGAYLDLALIENTLEVVTAMKLDKEPSSYATTIERKAAKHAAKVYVLLKELDPLFRGLLHKGTTPTRTEELWEQVQGVFKKHDRQQLSKYVKHNVEKIKKAPAVDKRGVPLLVTKRKFEAAEPKNGKVSAKVQKVVTGERIVKGKISATQQLLRAKRTFASSDAARAFCDKALRHSSQMFRSPLQKKQLPQVRVSQLIKGPMPGGLHKPSGRAQGSVISRNKKAGESGKADDQVGQDKPKMSIIAEEESINNLPPPPPDDDADGDNEEEEEEEDDQDLNDDEVAREGGGESGKGMLVQNPATGLHCLDCGKVLDPNEFYEENGGTYCEEDYRKLFLSCRACLLELQGGYLIMEGEKYHSECLKCAACGLIFADEPDSAVFTQNKRQYCAPDYYRLFGSVCQSCGEVILSGDKVTSYGKTYHAHHFTCFCCTDVINPDLDEDSEEEDWSGTHPYFYVNEQFVCLKDFQEQFAKKCHVCNENVLERGAVSTGDNVCHRACTKCSTCGASYNDNVKLAAQAAQAAAHAAQLAEEGGGGGSSQGSGEHGLPSTNSAPPTENQFFFGPNHTVLCQVHYLENVPKCASCGLPAEHSKVQLGEETFHVACLTCDSCREPISGALSRYNNHKFHPACVCCTICRTVFNPGETIFTKEDKLYCKEHYVKLFAPKCGTCDEPIGGRAMQVAGTKFHEACFVCFDCRQPFPDKKFKYKDGRVYCHSHVPAAFFLSALQGAQGAPPMSPALNSSTSTSSTATSATTSPTAATAATASSPRHSSVRHKQTKSEPPGAYGKIGE